MKDYGAIGHRVGQYIRLNKPTTQQIQGYLFDILANDEILAPLRELSTRSTFHRLVSYAASGKGEAQLIALKAEVSQLYLPEVVEKIESFCRGLLGLSMVAYTTEKYSSSAVDNAQQSSISAFSTKPVPTVSTISDPDLPYFSIASPFLLFWLCLFSFGLYDFIWTYQFWAHIKRRSLKHPEPIYPLNQRIIPFWCAFFSQFYIVGIARRIRGRLTDIGITGIGTRPWVAFLFFSIIPVFAERIDPDQLSGVNLSGRILLFIVYFLAQVFSSYQVYRLQRLANQSVLIESPNTRFRKRPNGWQCVILILGLIVWVFAFIGWLQST